MTVAPMSGSPPGDISSSRHITHPLSATAAAPVVASKYSPQSHLLVEAVRGATESARGMRYAIDTGSLRDSLKMASMMLGELRTDKLRPQEYFELYMTVFQELQVLAAFFADSSKHGRSFADLYECVQHAGNVLPRLYLLVTVGSSFSLDNADSKGALADMTEMCSGVQNPQKGIFLRYYLFQMSRDRLPVTLDQEGVKDAIRCILKNFVDAARLWIRLGFHAPIEHRERDREELRALVVVHLVKLCQLQGLTPSLVRTDILTPLLQFIVMSRGCCRYPPAQQLFLETVAQGLSPEALLHSLDILLENTLKLQPETDIRHFLSVLMKRVGAFLTEKRDTLHDMMTKDQQPTPPGLDMPAQVAGGGGQRTQSALEIVHGADALPIVEEADIFAGPGSAGGGESLQPSVLGEDPRDALQKECQHAVELIRDHVQRALEDALERLNPPPDTTHTGPAPATPDRKNAGMAKASLARSGPNAGNTGTHPGGVIPFVGLMALLDNYLAFLLLLLPDRMDLANECFHAVDILLGSYRSKAELQDTERIEIQPQSLASFFLRPLQAVPAVQEDIRILLQIPMYFKALSHRLLVVSERRTICRGLIQFFHSNKMLMWEDEALQFLLRVVAPLVVVPVSPAAGDSHEEEEADSTVPRWPQPAESSAGSSAGSSVGESDAVMVAGYFRFLVASQWTRSAGCGAQVLEGLQQHFMAMNTLMVSSEESQPSKLADVGEDIDPVELSPAAVTAVLPVLVQLACEVALRVVHEATAEASFHTIPFVWRGQEPATRPLEPILDQGRRGTDLLLDKLDTATSAVPKKLFGLAHSLATCLRGASPIMAFRKFLDASSHALLCCKLQKSHEGLPIDFSGFSAEFITEAWDVFEDDLCHNEDQYSALTGLMSHLTTVENLLEEEFYDAIVSKVAIQCTRLLRKVDQCRAILFCSHVFWENEEKRDVSRVVECLQKSIKVADQASASAQHAGLFVEILEKYMYYLTKGNDHIKGAHVTSLFSLALEHLESAKQRLRYHKVLPASRAPKGELETQEQHAILERHLRLLAQETAALKKDPTSPEIAARLAEVEIPQTFQTNA